MRLLEQVLGQGAMVLLAIPGAASRPAEPGHDAYELEELLAAPAGRDRPGGDVGVGLGVHPDAIVRMGPMLARELQLAFWPSWLGDRVDERGGRAYGRGPGARPRIPRGGAAPVRGSLRGSR